MCECLCWEEWVLCEVRGIPFVLPMTACLESQLYSGYSGNQFIVRQSPKAALKAWSTGSQKRRIPEQGLETIGRERELHLNSITSVSQSVLQGSAHYSE